MASEAKRLSDEKVTAIEMWASLNLAANDRDAIWSLVAEIRDWREKARLAAEGSKLLDEMLAKLEANPGPALPDVEITPELLAAISDERDCDATPAKPFSQALAECRELLRANGIKIDSREILRREAEDRAAVEAPAAFTGSVAQLLSSLGPSRSDVDRIARVLIAAWAKAEPSHGVTLHPTSYVATFADMARAALEAMPAPAPLSADDVAAAVEQVGLPRLAPCSHCDEWHEVRDGVVVYHSWPRPTRQCCSGSRKPPRVVVAEDFGSAGAAMVRSQMAMSDEDVKALCELRDYVNNSKNWEGLDDVKRALAKVIAAAGGAR